MKSKTNSHHNCSSIIRGTLLCILSLVWAIPAWATCPVVTTTADSGVGSLRDCISYANANPGTTISFNIPNTEPGYVDNPVDDWWRITVTSNLPTILVSNTVIDGSSQTANQGDTNSRGPEIELQGNGIPTMGLFINSSSNVTIRELVINSFNSYGIQLGGFGNTQHRLFGNYIGTNPLGDTALPNGLAGVYLVITSFTNIGGLNPGEENLISGNNGNGIRILGGNNNRIRGNKIGTNALETAFIPNTQDGVYLWDSAGTAVGSMTAGAQNTIAGNGTIGVSVNGSSGNSAIEGNIIRNNNRHGIESLSTNVTISGNTLWNNGSIGTNHGILLAGGATNNKVYQNTVHGTVGDGIRVAETGAVIRNNVLTGNGGYGINRIAASMAASQNLVTDASISPANGLGRSNVTLGITNLNSDPLYLDAAGGDFRITECTSPAAESGLDLGVAQPDMNGPVPGLYNGARPDMGALESSCVDSCPVVTNTSPVGPGSLSACILYANGNPGTTITFDIASAPNQSAGAESWWRITPTGGVLSITATGTTIDGASQRLNQGDTNSQGPEIELFGNNTINSGPVIANIDNVTIRELVVNSFVNFGIYVYGVGATQNKIYGNYLGTDAIGMNALPNGQAGVLLLALTDNDVGGINPGEGNLISGNGTSGIYSASSGNNRIRGNKIGTNRSGSAFIPNGEHGIYFSSGLGNTTGGPEPAAANLIAGNTLNGIWIDSNTSAILSNTIHNNGQYGILSTGNDVRIAGNSVYSNGGVGDDGIFISGSAPNNKIYHNTIHNNGRHGILLSAGGALIENNIVSGHGGGYGIDCTAAPTTLDYNDYFGNASGTTSAGCGGDGPNSISTDPLYLNAAGGDFRLTECSSPAVEAGIDLGADQPDINGASAGLYNGSNPDMGALESNCADSCPVVTNVTDAGPGSLRDCINYANSNPGSTISFNIASPPNQSAGGDSWWRIVPVSSLPPISAANTVIDGSSQRANYGIDTNTRGPEIELRGNGAATWGLAIIGLGVNNVTIEELVFNNFTDYGVYMVNTTGPHRLYGNYIGTDAIGENSGGGQGIAGVRLWVANSNRIGGVNPGEGNIISGNTGAGIEVTVGSNNLIQGNKIGTNRTGLNTAIPDIPNGSRGINILPGNNTVGGTQTGAGNIIAANTSQGVDISGSSVTVAGNTIRNNASWGIASAGTDNILTNNLIFNNGGAAQGGIRLAPGAANNKIYHSTIHGNGGDGLLIEEIGSIIRNNILTGNARLGINRLTPAMTESYNLVTDAATIPANNMGRSNIALDGTDLNSNPLFVSAGTGDFSLNECASPAINAGLDLGADQPDTNGASPGLYNSTAPDMGALETSVICTPANNAVTSAVSEISPTTVLESSTANTFLHETLPTINPGDTGINEITISAPAGYTNLSVASVSVGGASQTLNCPAPGASEYCPSVAGQDITVALGTKVTGSGTNILVNFTADAPGSPGIAPFATTVDDLSTGTPAQSASPGDADGDPANGNTLTVTIAGYAVTSALSEISPTGVAVNSRTNTMRCDILPTMNSGDTGVDTIQLIAPPGYTNLSVTGFSVDGTALNDGCPAPAATEYCASVAGQILTVALGDKVTASLTRLQVSFTADAPNATGSAVFTASLDDTTTPSAGPQSTTAGDADNDPSDSNSMTVDVVLALPDPSISRVVADPSIVIADGISASTITTTLLSVGAAPVSGRTISLASDRGSLDTFTQPASPTNANGETAGAVRSTRPGVTTISATDTTDSIPLSMTPQVYFTQGIVLELRKSANKEEAVVGDVITYVIELKNTTANDVVLVKINDKIPANFKYLGKSSRFNGGSITDPVGNRTLSFDLGTIPALVDRNGNGEADPGEPGYATLSYQLVIGSGATPRDYLNTAVARDVCDQCRISNGDTARVTVTLDPLFDLGTIIGKVFEDKDEDGWQDKNEPGVAGAMVALDNGTYALTDEHGRYHFPAVSPGHRLVKVNLQGLSTGAMSTTDQARVISVTPGLLAKANFGVIYRHDIEGIGRPKEIGLLMLSENQEKPIQVVGTAKALTVLINGKMAPLPASDVRMVVEGLEEVLELRGGRLERPIEFLVDVGNADEVANWRLLILNSTGDIIHTLSAEGSPPGILQWDGYTQERELVQGGSIYQYQIEVIYTDRTRTRGARRIFGVNQSSAISLNLTGGAFATGSSELSHEAEKILKETANVLRQFPLEKIVIEGHTDSIGLTKRNLALSELRARSAMAYLVEIEQIPKERFVLRPLGEAEPIASNQMPEGRELNRRVELKGEIMEVDRAKLLDQYRQEPVVKINGLFADVDRHGRFLANAQAQGTDALEVAITNSQGGSIQGSVPLPHLEILEPTGKKLYVYGDQGEEYQIGLPPADRGMNHGDVVMTHRLSGRTDPGNSVELDGKALTVDPEGVFSTRLPLKVGEKRYSLLVQNPQGYSRISDLMIRVADRDDKGRLIVAVEPIPHLTVKLPPKGVALKHHLLTISGRTDPGNRVHVNERVVPVQPDGGFTTSLALPMGKSLIVIRAIDPQGYGGTIEREVERSNTEMFFLGFADGKIGQLKGQGYLEGAGMDDATEYYTEGRIAYYLKGVIAGKYLITSAFDTGTKEFGDLFKDLDKADNDRLLTNLDPDKYYPVYGDSSTIVYDAQSQGKFYLAVDSEEFDLLVGNYALSLTDTELTTYQRTLYGAHLNYRSLARTKYGTPDTKIVVFGAQADQENVHDELRATGGSLYYLSHRDIIEGSEQVTLVVRDKGTGLVLLRRSQEQNVDYSIKYEEGRILFNRPISSVMEDDDLIDQSLLPGNPVFVYVDYERRLDSLDRTAAGGRVRKQFGDKFSLGGTYVKDDLDAGEYKLEGIDGEVRLGDNTRVLAEIAKSSGRGALVFASDDGGLTYLETLPNSTDTGEAWKIATEVDIGEWFKTPNRFHIGGYFKELDSGFVSSGNATEQGTRKTGITMSLELTQQDKLLSRYDREETDATAPEALRKSDTGTVQWLHDHGWWGLAAEAQTRNSEGGTGNSLEKSSTGAARLSAEPADDLRMHLEHQNTFTGPDNDQTTVGVEYQILPELALQASGTTGTRGQSALGGMVLSLDDKRFYLTERVDESKSGRSTATILGAESALGPSSKIYSEYQWAHSQANDQTISLTGAQKVWKVASGVQLKLSGEYSEIDSEPVATNRHTIAAGLSYENPHGFKASTNDEIRKEEGDQEKVQYLTTNGFEWRFKPDFTLLGKYRYSETSDHDLDELIAKFEELSLGLAYRPVSNDRFNALARYTRLSDQRPLSLGETESVVTDMDVASVEWSLDLNRYFEWVEKGAFRVKTETTGDRPAFKTHTYLSINRLNITLWPKIELGLEYRILAQKESEDARSGWLTELMWSATKHVRLGVGYNFTDFSDDEFSDNNYSVQGGFFRIQGKY